MSELIHTNNNRAAIRWKLLTSVSALAITLSSATAAQAGDSDRPLIWVEVGGQLEGLRGKDDTYAPPFVTAHLNRSYDPISPLSREGAPNFSLGGEAALSFQPRNSDWVFSANVRFGRSNGGKGLHQQTTSSYRIKTLKYNVKHKFTFENLTRFNDVQTKTEEEHAILDFMAGKDVGLGIFGHGSTSVVSAGVRYAQFRTHANIVFKSLPDPHWGTILPTTGNPNYHHHTYLATGKFSHDFQGIGPALSWKVSTPFAGNADKGEITLDWGANAALLFGRQSVRGNHLTSARYNKGKNYSRIIDTTPLDRSRRVTLPNLGGFAGLSVRYDDAKISIGYRGDFYFHAFDAGIDTRQTQTRGFFGPYASISVGLGD